jgi:hypothetical protein
MSAAIAATPAAPTSKKDGVVATITGQSSNDSSAYDTTKYPVEPEIRCYVKFQAPAGHTPGDDIKTTQFSTDSAGGMATLPLFLPDAGTWVVTLRKASDDSQLATTSVVVS